MITDKINIKLELYVIPFSLDGRFDTVAQVNSDYPLLREILLNWCEKNSDGAYSFTYSIEFVWEGYVSFELEEDAAAFKLRWS